MSGAYKRSLSNIRQRHQAGAIKEAMCVSVQGIYKSTIQLKTANRIKEESDFVESKIVSYEVDDWEEYDDENDIIY